MQKDAALLAQLWELVEPIVEGEGFELVDLQYLRSGRSARLRIFIDRTEQQGSVSVDDCAHISRLLSPALDVEDIIQCRYFLEVSSPGINRILRKPADFVRFAGKKVKLKTYEAVQGRRQFKGVLEGIHEDRVVITCNDSQYEISLDNIQRANLDVI